MEIFDISDKLFGPVHGACIRSRERFHPHSKPAAAIRSARQFPWELTSANRGEISFGASALRAPSLRRFCSPDKEIIRDPRGKISRKSFAKEKSLQRNEFSRFRRSRERRSGFASVPAQEMVDFPRDKFTLIKSEGNNARLKDSL